MTVFGVLLFHPFVTPAKAGVHGAAGSAVGFEVAVRDAGFRAHFDQIEDILMAQKDKLDIESLTTRFRQRRGSIRAYLVDAVIGLSVVYKAMDNMGAFQRWFGLQPNTKIAVLVFGFFHGFGLATKLQDFSLSSDGLIANLLAFNVGVEMGQILALSAILILMGYWRRTASFNRNAFAANTVLMTAGFLLTGYQLAGYFIGDPA